jgi:YgiT-type zinc finger domain-containing protein
MSNCTDWSGPRHLRRVQTTEFADASNPRQLSSLPRRTRMSLMINNHNRVSAHLLCDICRRESARIRRAARTYGNGKDLPVIENIPVVSCPHCGESYLTAETLHEIERIKLHRKSFAVERPVEVASFA